MFENRNLQRFFESVQAFASNTSGSVAIEYSLISTLVASATITGLAMLGASVDDTFTGVADQIAGERPPLNPPQMRNAN